MGKTLNLGSMLCFKVPDCVAGINFNYEGTHKCSAMQVSDREIDRHVSVEMEP